MQLMKLFNRNLKVNWSKNPHQAVIALHSLMNMDISCSLNVSECKYQVPI